MKTIIKSEEIRYSCITFKEALKMVSLMNNLVCEIEAMMKQIETAQTPAEYDMYNNDIQIIYSQYSILNNLGFESTIELQDATKSYLTLSSKQQ